MCDFGFATYHKVHKRTSFKGTRTYMAPEIMKQKAYDAKKTDVFSLGVILFIVVMGVFPFEEATDKDYFY